jgi:hypothetical protein
MGHRIWRQKNHLRRRAEMSHREMVGMEGLAPPRLPDSESGPSAVRVERHARKLVHPAGLPPANSPFVAEDDCNFTTDAGTKAEVRMQNEDTSHRFSAGIILHSSICLLL